MNRFRILSLFTLIVSTATADVIFVIERNMRTPIGTSTLIKAQENNLVIGCVAYVQKKPLPMIFNFYVDPKYRRSGIGVKLLKTAFQDIVAQKQYTAVEIEAAPEEEPNALNLDQLINFYKRFGFQVLKNDGRRAYMIGSLPPHIPPVRSSNNLLPEILNFFKPAISASE